MIGAELGATAALALLGAAGYPFARYFQLKGALLLACSWLFGCGAIAVALVCLSVLKLPFTRVSLGVAWLVVIGFGMLCRGLGRASASADAHRPGGVGPLNVTLAALCAFQVMYVLLVAVRVPLGSFDAWSLWDFKGLQIWHSGGLSGASIIDRSVIFSHPAYPPLLPLVIAWVYTWAGSGDPVLMKPIFPVFYAALLLAFAGALRPLYEARTALVGSLCLALIPRLTDYAGTGLADVPLAAFLISAAALWTVAYKGDQDQLWLAGGVLLGMAACIKHDGLVYFGAALIALPVLRIKSSSIARAIGISLVIAAPWYLYVAARHAPDRDFYAATAENVVHFASRIPGIARLFSLNLLATNEWGLLWLAWATLVIRSVVRGSRRGLVLLIPVLAPMIFYVCSLSLSAWPDYTLHTRTSLDRLIMVTTPFALWYVVDQVVAIAGGHATNGRHVTSRLPPTPAKQALGQETDL